MSVTTPMKASTRKDALAKTVKLLIREGIQVDFRGFQPMVQSKGDKAVRLVLPELNDDAPPELVEAIQGFLDHEVGHILFTPFAKASRAGRKSSLHAPLLNIIEDIRLEKLMPRQFPGTKYNLEVMYEKMMDQFFGKPVEAAVETKNPQAIFMSIFVVAFRALSGQRPFQAYMDKHKLWRYFAPLMTAMPDLSKRLRRIEDYSEVIKLTEDVVAVFENQKIVVPPPEAQESDDTPPPPPPPSKPNEPDDEPSGDDEPSTGECDEGGDEDAPAAEGDEPADGDDGGEPADGDEPADGGDDATDDGDTQAGDDADEKGDDAGGEEGGEPDQPQDTSDDGKGKRTITEALKMLEPTQRQAMFMYKKQKKAISEISQEMNITEDEVKDAIRKARRNLSVYMNGAN